MGFNQLNYLDCTLAPKLQHLRIASNYFGKFKISTKFVFIWTYLKHIYQTSVFQITCPSDRNIILTYLEKIVGSENLQMLAKHKKIIFKMNIKQITMTYPNKIIK